MKKQMQGRREKVHPCKISDLHIFFIYFFFGKHPLFTGQQRGGARAGGEREVKLREKKIGTKGAKITYILSPRVLAQASATHSVKRSQTLHVHIKEEKSG